MKIIILDDDGRAFSHSQKVFAEIARDLNVPVDLDTQLSKQILAVNYQDTLGALETLAGEGLLIFVDMGFNLAAGDKELEDRLRARFVIGTEIPVHQLDGAAYTIALIRNQNIKRSTILLNTGRSAQGPLKKYFRTVVRDLDRERAIRVEAAFEGMALTDSEVDARSIILDGIQKHVAFLTQSEASSGPIPTISSFNFFLLKAHEMDHTLCETEASAVAALATLLSLSEKQVKDDIFDRVPPRVIFDALKTMGTNVTERPLAASGAWLIALAAFRHVAPTQHWATLFDVAQLADPELRTCYLFPSQQIGTLRGSIRTFYTLCRQLFEPAPHATEAPASPSPLLQVSLDRGLGLRFLLDFPCNERVRGDSLFQNVADCRHRALRDGKIHDHGTSRAIWECWIAGSIADYSLDDGLFGKNVWRPNVFPATVAAGRSQTEVVFFK